MVLMSFQQCDFETAFEQWEQMLGQVHQCGMVTISKAIMTCNCCNYV